jgi:predicted NBD/HSP70 family sugar kinase
MPHRGSNHQTVKQLNRGLVLKLISTGICQTRVALARQTRMSKMTITNIIAELVENGYLEESYPPLMPGKRRNVIEIDISPHAPKILGVYVSRSKCAVVLMNLKMQRLKYLVETLSNETADTLTQRIVRLLREIMPVNERVIGIGVSIIGQYDAKSGYVLCPVDFFGIKDYGIKHILADTFNLPVFTDNDMNCAAILEKLYGHGKNLSDFIYVGWTDGVGAGIISNGTLFSAGSGFVGEIGHMSVNFNGEPCSCGNFGCLELYTSVNVVLRHIKEKTGREMDFLTMIGNHDDPVVDFELKQVCRYYAIALISVVNLLDPQMIIFGHKAVHLPEKYLRYIQEEINSRFISRAYKSVPVKISAFSDLTPVYGSACCIANQLFEGKYL